LVTNVIFGKYKLSLPDNRLNFECICVLNDTTAGAFDLELYKAGNVIVGALADKLKHRS